MTQNDSPATEIRPQDLVPPDDAVRFPYVTLNQGAGEKRPDWDRPIVWYDAQPDSINPGTSKRLHDQSNKVTLRAVYMENNSLQNCRWNVGVDAGQGDMQLPAGAAIESVEVIDVFSIYNSGNVPVGINDGTAGCIRVRLGL